MTYAFPFPLVWTDEGCFRPLTKYWEKKADDRFVVGLKYLMVEQQERSLNSHNHYFAALTEAWQNLPEDISFEFPTSEHLRKRALIMTGYRDERSIVCASKAEAMRFAAFIKPMDDFAVVSIHECAVVVWTAKSQSMRAMGKKEFNASKQSVLAWAWNLVGIDAEIGNREAGHAA